MSKHGWVLNESKFLCTSEVRRLVRATKRRVEGPEGRCSGTAVRDHLVVALDLSTGLRVSEIAGLRCGDLFIGCGMSSLIVRKGKGGKQRTVALNQEIRNHLLKYLRWKKDAGESVGPEAPLLLSSRTGRAMTTRAIQKAFKRCASLAGLSRRFSIHSLRHTYACHLYKASKWNLRLVQKQLGHSSIATTQVYADVMEPDLRPALERLYKCA